MVQGTPDRGPALTHAMVALIVLCDVSVLLRFASRRIAKAGFASDDYLAVIAMLLANANAICVLVAVHYDFGKHVKDARPDAVAKWYKILYVYQNFYVAAVATTKFSILLFYNRVFSTRSFRMVLHVIGATVMMWWIAMQFASIFTCTPIDFTWTRHGPGHCINLERFYLGQAIPNIVTDIVLLSITIPMIWRLQLPRSQKVALSGVFLLGSFVVFASIYRLVLLFEHSTARDVIWSNFGIVLWSAIEPNIGVVSACLPSCRPIFRLCIRSIVTLKDTTISTLETRSKGKATVDRHDFVPLVGNRRAHGPGDEIPLQEFGVQTSIEGDQTGFRRERKVPIDAVHIRSDVKVQDS